MKALARASGRHVLGGLPATYSEYDSIRHGGEPLLSHIPMGKGLYTADAGAQNFLGVMAFFARNYATTFGPGAHRSTARLAGKTLTGAAGRQRGAPRGSCAGMRVASRWRVPKSLITGRAGLRLGGSGGARRRRAHEDATGRWRAVGGPPSRRRTGRTQVASTPGDAGCASFMGSLRWKGRAPGAGTEGDEAVACNETAIEVTTVAVGGALAIARGPGVAGRVTMARMSSLGERHLGARPLRQQAGTAPRRVGGADSSARWSAASIPLLGSLSGGVRRGGRAVSASAARTCVVVRRTRARRA